MWLSLSFFLCSVVRGGRGGLPGGDGVQRAADEARRPAAPRPLVQGGTQLAHLHLRRARQELPRRGGPLLAPGTHTAHSGCPPVEFLNSLKTT